MTAAPFNKNPRTKHITNDGNAIRAAGNVLSVLMVKTHFGTGAIYKPSHSFFENIIGHMKNSFSELSDIRKRRLKCHRFAVITAHQCGSGYKKTTGGSPLENNCHMAWTLGGSNTLTEIFSCLSWS